ncbi:type 4b pilus protein PilO2 [Acinetobacter variabilis]|uniref:type 4b pilus protein PilO2 n=1 Tax=Acinetobacter variabilis TaxID=70346 RepID=UPI0028A9B8E5|nr:type 4b pilus protein PilO2 [Acinetobacter variabilis]
MEKETDSAAKESSVNIITVNNRRFVIGLHWRGLQSPRHYMKQAKEIGKKEKLDVVAIRQGIGIQAGFAAKKSGSLKGMYSLALSLVSLLDGEWIGAFALPENNDGEKEYYLLARQQDGKIVPWTDKVYARDQIEKEITEIKAMILSDDNNNAVTVYGDESLDWVNSPLTLDDVLLPARLKKTFKLRPLTLGMTKKQLVMLSMVSLAVFLLALVGFTYYQSVKEEEELQQLILNQQRLALAKKARYETALKNMVHPWVTQADVSQFIRYCDIRLKLGVLSLGGWPISSVECDKDVVRLTFIKMENSVATVDSFRTAAYERFGKNIQIDFAKDFTVASFTLKNEMNGNGDDPLPRIGEQVTAMMSLFQGAGVQLILKPVPYDEEKMKKEHPDDPLQNWREVSFNYESENPARTIFKNNEILGVRITKISYVPNYDSGSLKYLVEGMIYGKP